MYLTLKAIHVAALVAFLGNISLAMVWKWHADRSRNPAIMAHVLHGVVAGDRWITVPGAAILFISGVAMAVLGGLPLLHTGWIWKASLAFAASGVLYLYPIGPDQRRMERMALAAHGDPAALDWGAYAALSRRWLLFGLLAITALLVAMALMIYKPIA